MRNRCSIATRLVATVIVGYGLGQCQEANAPRDSTPAHPGNLIVRLLTRDTVFQLDHPVPVRVELQNCGQKDVWIALSYEENLGSPANLSVTVRDLHRRIVPPNTAILVGGLGKPPYEWWVRLPPGYLFGRDFLLTQYHSAFMHIPGKYQITASYTGIASTTPGNTNVPANREDIFMGHVESNPLEVEILPKRGP